jgi:hypothetical protein
LALLGLEGHCEPAKQSVAIYAMDYMFCLLVHFGNIEQIASQARNDGLKPQRKRLRIFLCLPFAWGPWLVGESSLLNGHCLDCNSNKGTACQIESKATGASLWLYWI